MLTGKNYPQNPCALRMDAEEVLRDILVKVHSFEELMIGLATRSVKSRTVKYWIQNCQTSAAHNNNNNNGRNGSFLRGWLHHRGKAQMACNYCFEDNVLNKFRILKEMHVQMRKPYQSPEKLILLYCPGRRLNSRPPAHRSFKHGQGVPRP